MLHRSQRRFAGWLALAAVTLHFLAPLVSQALASWSDAPDFWQQVCSIHGSNQASTNGAPSSPTQDDANGQVGDCPFCLLHLAHWAPTPQIEAIVLEPDGEPPAPGYKALAAQSRLFWQSPQSRAPPALC